MAAEEKTKKGRGIGGYTRPNNGRHELWLTPPWILRAIGSFDLDPCACPEPRPWSVAREHIALPDDGLALPWKGRVFLNPPYGERVGIWMERMAAYRNGISLVFARTETEVWTRHVWPAADSVLFVAGRLHFHLPDGTRAHGNSGGPSALIAYTEFDSRCLVRSGIPGTLVRVVNGRP